MGPSRNSVRDHKGASVGRPISIQISLLLIALICASVAPGFPQELPIFDAHIHYNRPDWDAISVEQVLAILERAGVRWALVSSIPDDGTLMLYEKAPQRVVPFLRPYRTRRDIQTWHSDPAVQAYVEERLRRKVYRGLGELYLSAEHVDAPVVKRFAELAVQKQLFLHVKADDVTMERVLRLYPRVRILWAHAGVSVPPARVGQLLDQFPNLWVELALRSDVAPGGLLQQEWRALFLRHPNRFMVGSSSSWKRTLPKFFSLFSHPNGLFMLVTAPRVAWVTSRWETLADGVRNTRAWLDQIPRDAAKQIAYQNAERLFGSHPEQRPK